MFVSTESNPVADVFTNPAVGKAPKVIVDVDFPITIGFIPVPAVPIFMVPVVIAVPPILIVPVVVFANNVWVVPVADVAFMTSIVGVVNVAFVPNDVSADAVDTELNNVPVAVGNVNVAAPLVIVVITGAVENVLTLVIDCAVPKSINVTVPEGIVATVVAADDKPNVSDAAVFVARVDPVINVNVADVVGAVIVTLLIVEDVVIAPFKAIVAFVCPIVIGVTPVPTAAILRAPVVSPAPIAIEPVVTVGCNEVVAPTADADIESITGVVIVGDDPVIYAFVSYDQVPAVFFTRPVPDTVNPATPVKLELEA